jgi:hypothetical protein
MGAPGNGLTTELTGYAGQKIVTTDFNHVLGFWHHVISAENLMIENETGWLVIALRPQTPKRIRGV